MKHKKRGLALLLMLTLALLCGCEGTVSERPMEDISALDDRAGSGRADGGHVRGCRRRR